MRKFLRRLVVVVGLLSPLAANAQDALLDQVAKAMGAAGVKSIQYTGSGVNFQVEFMSGREFGLRIRGDGLLLLNRARALVEALERSLGAAD